MVAWISSSLASGGSEMESFTFTIVLLPPSDLRCNEVRTLTLRASLERRINARLKSFCGRAHLWHPPQMATTDPKVHLKRYLQTAREAMLWKLDGLDEYEIRRPSTPTGTNLLGLVKHLASVEAGYFGATFGRPFPEPLPWYEDDAEPNADMWATADESREQVVGFYRRVWSHSDATIASL